MSMKDEVLQAMKAKMEKGILAYQKELNRLRTGRASPALLEGIRVDYYGTPTPIQQTASIAIPESRLITIQPWDKNTIEAIEKAIQKANLGLSPSNDGKVIRIAIPPLTEDRRKELVKVVKKMAEECKVTIRNVRREANDSLKKLEKDKKLSEDDLHRAADEVQKITDGQIEHIDQILEAKQKEILEK
ncbi:MAG: ribosome recycling factor [bacterium]